MSVRNWLLGKLLDAEVELRGLRDEMADLRRDRTALIANYEACQDAYAHLKLQWDGNTSETAELRARVVELSQPTKVYTIKQMVRNESGDVAYQILRILGVQMAGGHTTIMCQAEE